jgi:hypothetical protein
VEATLGPPPPAADLPAPPANGVVATPRHLAAAMLGPLISPGSRFLELLVVVDAPGFNSLRLPDAVRRVIHAHGPAAGEIALGEQSRPDLFWPVDIFFGAGGDAALTRRWGCRGDDLGGAPRARQYAGLHPRNPRGFGARGPAPPEGPAAPAAG